MFNIIKLLPLPFVLISFLSLQGGCALVGEPAPDRVSNLALYRPLAEEGENILLQRYAPHFEVRDYQFDYNRIGAATARPTATDDYEVFIDTSRPTIYTLTQKFTTEKGEYTNLIYRIHFPAVPWPHLTWGNNVGLLVYVTLNAREEPVLITTLHTCGCYLAMIPTNKLPREYWPAGWPSNGQNIYGEMLPGRLNLPEQEPYGRLVISIKGRTHRVMKIEFRQGSETAGAVDPPTGLAPMADLEALPLGDRKVSFFEREGRRRGYVKGNSKPLELLFMSWWALDPEVGQDKALGPPEETGVNFYTSLKFWSRNDSNIWNFPQFLKFWGWDF